MAATRRSLETAAFELLVCKYQADPSWFERHLPDIGEIVRHAESPLQRPRTPFGLTIRERAFHTEALSHLQLANELGHQDAVKALEHCASLIRDGSLPDYMDHETLVSLFRSAFGKSPNSFRKNTTVPIEGLADLESVYRVSLVRGVVLNLNLEMRLVSVEITPRKVREYKKLMSIVGIGHDSSRDVSSRHDEYLAEQMPHGDS